MSINYSPLIVVQSGRHCTVSFSHPQEVLMVDTCQCRQTLQDLLADQRVETLEFDLTPVQAISSEVLGLMMWLLQQDVHVGVLNPSAYVREVLEATQLDQRVRVRERAPDSSTITAAT